MSLDSLKTVRVNVAHGIARITLDNGDVNLFTRDMFAELTRVGQALAQDDAVRVVILHSANPDFFIAHYDVAHILQYPQQREVPLTEMKPFHAMCETFRTMPKATIAVIEGRVGGGGSELALSFDMRFALRGKAVFNQPEVALGIIPGGSGTVRLPRLIGRSRALEVILGCDDVDAELAEAWGSKRVDLGAVGHLNPASGYGEWPRAEALIAELALPRSPVPVDPAIES